MKQLVFSMFHSPHNMAETATFESEGIWNSDLGRTLKLGMIHDELEPFTVQYIYDIACHTYDTSYIDILRV